MFIAMYLYRNWPSNYIESAKFHLVGFWKCLHSSSSIDCLRWKRLDFQKHLAPTLSDNFSVLWYWHVIMRTDQPYWFAVFVSYGWNDEIFITTCLYRPLREQEDTMSNDNVRGLWFHIPKFVRKLCDRHWHKNILYVIFLIKFVFKILM